VSAVAVAKIADDCRVRANVRAVVYRIDVFAAFLHNCVMPVFRKIGFGLLGLAAGSAGGASVGLLGGLA
jgi:hypothetical protein